MKKILFILLLSFLFVSRTDAIELSVEEFNELFGGSSSTLLGASVLFPYQGGTGTSTAPIGGKLLIGFDDGKYGPMDLTAGTNITISTSSGSITINSTASGGSSFGQVWEFPTGVTTYVSPTTTPIGIHVPSASSTIGWLSIDNSTTTNATTTTLYVDDKATFNNAVHGITLNKIEDPTADKLFTFPNNIEITWRSNDNTPAAGEGVFNYEAIGAFTGDVVHFHQHTGNPGVTNLLHAEAEDGDVMLMRLTHENASTSPALFVQSGTTNLTGGLVTMNNASSTNFTSYTLSVGGTGTTSIDRSGNATTTILRVSGVSSFGGSVTLGGNFIFDSQSFDSLTDDATLENNAGDLRVVTTSLDISLTDTNADGAASSSFAMSNGSAVVWNNFVGAANTAIDNRINASSGIISLICPDGQVPTSTGSGWECEDISANFEPVLTKGDLTEDTSSVLTVTNGTGAVIGSGTTLQVLQASGSQAGYLSSTDWLYFNDKVSTSSIDSIADLDALVGPEDVASTTSAMTGTYDGNNFAGGAIGEGDLLYGSAAGVISELGKGGSSTVLISNGTLPVYNGIIPIISDYISESSTIINLSCPLGRIASSTGTGWTCADPVAGAGGSSAWTDNGTTLTPAGGEGILVQNESSTIGFLSMNYSTTTYGTTTNFYANNATTTSLRVDNLFELNGNFKFDSQVFDSLTDDATLTNNSGDLKVVTTTLNIVSTDLKTDGAASSSMLTATAAGTPTWTLQPQFSTLQISGITYPNGGIFSIASSTFNWLSIEHSTTTYATTTFGYINNATTTNLYVENLIQLANPLAVAYGGTGLSTYSQGDIIIADAANSLASLSFTASSSFPVFNGTNMVSNNLIPIIADYISESSTIIHLSCPVGQLASSTGSGWTCANPQVGGSGGTGYWTDAGTTLNPTGGEGILVQNESSTIGWLSMNYSTTTYATTTFGYIQNATTTSLYVESLVQAVTGLKIPNGTACVADSDGKICHDTSDNQLIIDSLVVPTNNVRIWGVTVASTSPAFIGETLLKIPTMLDGYTMSAIRCSVQGGTSKIIAIEDESTNSTEDITCTTSVTADDGSITNAAVTAAEEMYIDFGATDGTVDYVTISVFGDWTRE